MEDLKGTVDNFQKKQVDFLDAFQHNCEIIRRYDEVLSEKASKFALKDLKIEIYKD